MEWRVSESIEIVESSMSRATLCLAWEDLTIMRGNRNSRNGTGATRNKLINGLNGYAESNRITAIMGPSGSGKSTLLDALTGRLPPNIVMTGKVWLNDKQRSIAGRNKISYVAQEEFLLGTLTVRETLTYSANLRLPSTMTKDEIKTMVERTIAKMGLEHCRHNNIGNWYSSGISGGERRRLSIALEILTQPHVMCLDEPTTGLDSASAFFLIATLKSIAEDGRVVVFSIHQPSSNIFELIDDLCLLSSGETVYFGQAKTAAKFLAEAGFPCPTRRNPADHFLQLINSNFDKIAAAARETRFERDSEATSRSSMKVTTKDIIATLVQNYMISHYASNTRKRIQEISLEEVATVTNKSQACWWKQLYVLTQRSQVHMSRDLGYYWLRILFSILVSLSVGNLYFDVGLSGSEIITRIRLEAYIFGFLMCLNCGGIPFFIHEWKVSYHEVLNGHYGESASSLANFLASLPFLVVISLSSGTIMYYMVKFHPGFSHYCYFCLALLCCFSITEAIMMIVAILVPNLSIAVGVSIAAIVLCMMASTVFRQRVEQPTFFWRYPMSYISFISWAIEGQMKNDMIGLEFDNPIVGEGEEKLGGEKALREIIGIELNYSKWWDLAALVVLLLSHRLLFYVVLKYKGRASSAFHRLYAKRVCFNIPQLFRQYRGYS